MLLFMIGGLQLDTKEFQRLLLSIMPQWHYHIAKPFKQLFDRGISLEMYYSIQLLHGCGDMLTMSELASRTKMPKQQMTKIVSKLIEHDFVERINDKDDRRIIRLHVTDKALKYIDRFLDEEAVFFKELLDNVDADDRDELFSALTSINRILGTLPVNCRCDKSDNDT